MFELKIFDTENNKAWVEIFDSPFLLQKRKNKLKYSKKLKVVFEIAY